LRRYSLVLSAEHALPIRPDMLSFNRQLVRAQRVVPVAKVRPCHILLATSSSAFQISVS
jgi:hypothetical protein